MTGLLVLAAALALAATGGNRTKAAERLGVSAKTLTSKIRELGL